METSATVVEDSICAGARITTLSLVYPRIVHAELMTHRVFSRNASSSRAIPVSKMLSQVWNDPAYPAQWGLNQPGMQARKVASGFRLWAGRAVWKTAGRIMCVFAWLLMQLGFHKQIANRLLEAWQLIRVVLTETEWDNWFELRDHPDADPTIQVLARRMREALEASTPKELEAYQWHLPYTNEDERHCFDPEILVKISTARCARVSYLTHEGTDPSPLRDMELHDRLVVAKPMHASPTEHPARALGTEEQVKNFRGWLQYRWFLEKGEVVT